MDQNREVEEAANAPAKISLRDFREHEHLNCPQCHQLYENPQLLPCLDSVCENCINAHPVEAGRQPAEGAPAQEIEYENFLCPNECCRKQFTTNALAGEVINNRFLANIVEAVKLQDDFCKGTEEVLCNACIKKNIAVAVCLEASCRKLLCQKCRNNHLEGVDTYRHGVLEVGRLHNNGDALQEPAQDIIRKDWYCHLHPDQLVRMYCAQHEEVICHVCANDHHRECRNCKSVETLFADSNPLPRMQRMIQQVKDKNDEIQQAKDRINNIKAELERAQERVTQSIDDQYDAIARQLDEWRNRLKEQVAVMCRSKAELLDHQHKILERVHQNVSHSLMFIEDSVNIATNVEFYFLKSPFKRRLRELNSILNDTHKDPLENSTLRHNHFEVEVGNIHAIVEVLGSVHSTPSVPHFTVVENNGMPQVEFEVGKESEIVINCNDASGTIVNNLDIQSVPRLQAKLIPINEGDDGAHIDPEEAQNAVTGTVKVNTSGGTYSIQVVPQVLGAHRLYVYRKRPAPYEIEFINNRQPLNVTVVPRNMGRLSLLPWNTHV